MLVPLNWLKEYVPVKYDLKELMWRLTEAGMTTESYKEIDGDKVLDVEVTANRPDWMSVIGIAREVAAIENTYIKLPEIHSLPKKTTNLPITIDSNYELCPRYTAIIIKNVKQQPSPLWMQERLKHIGLRPINNLVDITNYVMFEMGNPIHVFDYDKVKNDTMTLTTTKGGERFVSVDEKEYTLPKNSIIFKNNKNIVDLCGIKGGLNSAVSETTTNILILVAVYNGILIRRTSLKLGLYSDASRIFERGANTGGTLDTLKRAVDLTLQFAGGEIASDILDDKKGNFRPWKLKLNLHTLNKKLGISIPKKDVFQILKKLNLSPILKDNIVTCTIPTYRADLKIEEDLNEEVARIYGYNNFPRTLPQGSVRKEKVPYYYDRDWEISLKNLMTAAGYSEIKTLSLQSEKIIKDSLLPLDKHIKIANPVSSDYEYLRSSVIPGLLSAVKLNTDRSNLKFFEYGKTYFAPLEKRQEPYFITAMETGGSYRTIKGLLDLVLQRLNINDINIENSNYDIRTWYPGKSGIIKKNNELIGIIGEINPQVLFNFGIKNNVYAVELHSEKLKHVSTISQYQQLSKYPAQIEDVTLTIPKGIAIQDVVNVIYKTDKYIKKVELIDIYENSYSFRLQYLNPNTSMTDKEVESIRKTFQKELKERYKVVSK